MNEPQHQNTHNSLKTKRFKHSKHHTHIVRFVFVPVYVLAGLLFLTSCSDMYLPPKNTLTDDDLMSSEAGLSIYMSRMYSQMPWEDFKYMAQWGLPRRNSWLGCLGVEGTGEAVNRDGVTTAFRGEDDHGGVHHIL